MLPNSTEKPGNSNYYSYCDPNIKYLSLKSSQCKPSSVKSENNHELSGMWEMK